MGQIEIIGGYNRQLSDKECCIIRDMMLYEDGIRQIFGNNNRLIGAAYDGLVKYDDEYIGFFLLVEERIKGIYFIDRGIKEQYRGLGIGTLILEYIINNYRGNHETKKSNIAANKSASKYGTLIYSTDDLNYYLFNKSKEEFIESGMYDRFVEYEDKPKIKSYEMIRKIMNGE